MNFRIIGDSHVQALAMGLTMRKQQGLPEPKNLATSFCYLGNGFHLSEPFWERQGNSLRMLRDDYAASLAEATGSPAISAAQGTVYGLCMGLHTARVFRNPMWKDFVPWNVAPSGGETPVSSGAMDRIFDEDAKYIVGFFEEMRDLSIPFLVISAPPPYRFHSCMTEDGLRPAVVVEVDRAYRARIRKQLDLLGVPCVTPPESAYDAMGFMHPKYRIGVVEHDPHHGNADYGQRMVARIFSRMIEYRRQLHQAQASRGADAAQPTGR